MEVAGIEPDTPCTESLASIEGSEFLPQILTEIFGPKNQILARIVERWSDLSNELKGVVLRAYEMSPIPILWAYRIMMLGLFAAQTVALKNAELKR